MAARPSGDVGVKRSPRTGVARTLTRTAPGRGCCGRANVSGAHRSVAVAVDNAERAVRRADILQGFIFAAMRDAGPLPWDFLDCSVSVSGSPLFSFN